MQEQSVDAGTVENSSKGMLDILSDAFSSFRSGNYVDGTELLLGEFIAPAAVGLLSLLAAYFIVKLISGRAAAILCRRVDETLGKFVGKLLFYSLMSVATVSILAQLNFQVSGFMAVLATAGFAIGLAFQGTLSNFSAGILLLVFRPFKVGDMVNVASVMGKVNEIDIFTTTLDTPDNRRLIIPNSAIASGTIENISYHPHRRVEVIVGVEYSANIERTRLALTEAVHAMSEMVVPGENRGHQIVLSNLGASSVDWMVRIWVAKENFFAAKELLTGHIKNSLGQHQIAIPFPQLHLHMSPAEESSARTDAPPPTFSVPTIHTGTAKVRPRHRSDSVDRAS